MKHLSSRSLLVLSLAALLAGCSRPAPKAQLVISGGTLLDMAGDEPQPKPLKGVVVNGGKIDRVILAGEPGALPEAETTVDATGQYVLPGLIDAHVHFRPWHPRPSLAWGLTTLHDTGPCGAECGVDDPNAWIVGLARKVNAADSDGPTLYYTGKKLDGPEGKTDIEVTRLATIDDVVPRIEELVKLGAHSIKAEEYLPPDFRTRIIQESDKRGMAVVGHSANAQVSIDAGMKFIEHMYPIGRALATDPAKAEKDPDPMHMIDTSKIGDFTQKMADARVYLNPTLLGRYSNMSPRAREFAAEAGQWLNAPLYAELPKDLHKGLVDRYLSAEKMKPADLARAQKGFANVNAVVKEFAARGGHLIIGSDTSSGRVPGLAFHQEMRMMADAGVPNYRVLLAATRWSAELMRKDSEIGTVAPGKQADLVILSADPVADIANSRKITTVIRQGKRVSTGPGAN